MDISLFDYHLPEELIAQYPSRQRDESRLMVLDRRTGDIRVGGFRDLLDYVGMGDLLVVNNTRVFKARLLGRRKTGGVVEIFLIRRVADEPFVWEAYVQPYKRVREGEEILFASELGCDALKVILEGRLLGGKWFIRFASEGTEKAIIGEFGHVPLPQYIKRPDIPDDIERYQTIFARKEQTGAVAAPTAGFHFTPELVTQLRFKGVGFAEVTLHVGPGTFKPIKVNDVTLHQVDPEFASVTGETVVKLKQTEAGRGRVIAVGTTSVRTLESSAAATGLPQAFDGMVDLFIRPGFKFQVVDALVTNFHLPKSSLLVLVSAFAGRELVLEAYRQAISEKMRFYSYGDAMLIL